MREGALHVSSIDVGNLPYTATEDQIRNLFDAYGTVERVSLIIDRDTGRIKGFGFVDMSSGAQAAIASLDQSELDGRTITVNVAKPRQERPRQSRRW
jgi:cold-inducible RNA-binding protein